MNAEHFDSVKALITANADLADKISDTFLEDTDGQLLRAAYVILYGGSPDKLGDARFTAPQLPTSRRTHVYTVRSVGPDAATARRLSDACATQLLHAKPTIAGRRCDPIVQTLGGEVQFDRTLTPPLPYIDDEYTLVTYPA